MVDFLADFVIKVLQMHSDTSNMDPFVKKSMKIYKALRVLERSKKSDTPVYSKPFEKLINFFTMKFPEKIRPQTELRKTRNFSGARTTTGRPISTKSNVRSSRPYSQKSNQSMHTKPILSDSQIFETEIIPPIETPINLNQQFRVQSAI